MSYNISLKVNRIQLLSGRKLTMKPNKTIREMDSYKLIKALEKEMIAYGGQMYGDNQTQSLPRFSKNKISMLRSELFKRLKVSDINQQEEIKEIPTEPIAPKLREDKDNYMDKLLKKYGRNKH